jgi:hypothetical protein
MRVAIATLFFFLAQPFWEAKPPERWTAQEIEEIRHDSPWAQSVGPDPKIVIYLATAAPIEDAEAEARVRARNPLDEPDPDYLDYLRENRDTRLVVAVPYSKKGAVASAKFALAKAEELHRMEDESVMLVGHKTYKMVGHFPPTDADPVLRLVFPREADASDKTVVFRLYLPGVEFPDREAEFHIKELSYHGKLAM